MTRPVALFRLGGAAVAAVLSLAACKATETAKAPEPAPAAPAAAPAPAEASPAAPAAAAPAAAAAPSIYPIKMHRLDGTPATLSEWSGKVLLIVNTASKCGYTPQYEGLQKLHAKYSPRGFAVLGFPSNDFGGQEPGSAQEIAKFCTSIYAVNFPMFEKTKVKGEEQNELYALLSKALGEPHWNFHKYLIDKQGHPVKAWESKVEPGADEITSAIEAQLGAS
jgi:glutathione peroxidase